MGIQYKIMGIQYKIMGIQYKIMGDTVQNNVDTVQNKWKRKIIMMEKVFKKYVKNINALCNKKIKFLKIKKKFKVFC